MRQAASVLVLALVGGCGAVQAQAVLGQNLLARPVPTSLVQLWVPRVELHLFYNTIVFLPMVIAMCYHLFPASAGRHPAAVLLRAARVGQRGGRVAIARQALRHGPAL